jgi:hypothetical protein
MQIRNDHIQKTQPPHRATSREEKKAWVFEMIKFKRDTSNSENTVSTHPNQREREQQQEQARVVNTLER